MKIEIIQSPNHTYAIFVNNSLESDGWRTKRDATIHAQLIKKEVSK